MQQQLNLCRKELTVVQEEKENMDNTYAVVSKASKAPVLSQFEADSYKVAVAATEKIPSMQAKRASLEIELSKLDLLYLERLQKEIFN